VEFATVASVALAIAEPNGLHAADVDGAFAVLKSMRYMPNHDQKPE